MKHVVLKNQIVKICVIFALTTIICIWQGSFILSAIKANLVINGTILSVFIAAIGLTMMYLFGTYDEHKTIDSLEEDRRLANDKLINKDEIIKKSLRLCFDIPVMVKKPRLFEQASRTIQQEMALRGQLEMSDHTLQIIMDRIDENIAKNKITLNFFGNTLILLGLIGTFIGLMLTVGSIGAILGSLQTTASGGDVFTQLLSNLQKPLSGMATGFSSSLFGLMGALVISVITQFLGEAHNEVRQRFESWINDVAKIANSTTAQQNSGDSTGSGSGGMNEELIAKLISLTEKSVNSTKNIASAVDEFYVGVRAYTELQIDQAKAEKHTANNLMRLTNICEHIKTELEDVSEGGATIEEVKKLHGLISTSYSALDQQREHLEQSAHQASTNVDNGVKVQKNILNADQSLDDTINNLENELKGLLSSKEMRKRRKNKSKIATKNVKKAASDRGDR